MARLASSATLWTAWRRVAVRGAAAGIDGITLADYSKDVAARLSFLGERLLQDTYRPRPARRVVLADAPQRPVAVSCVEDRIVQRALADVLGPLLEAEMGATSFAYRPRKAVRTALDEVERQLAAGRRYVVRTDVEKFFDRVDREGLLQMLAVRDVGVGCVRLVDRLLRAGQVHGSGLFDDGLGLQQGSPLSPLLSNLWLTPVDQVMASEGHVCLRYADDLLLLANDEAGARTALEALRAHLEARGHTLNARKTTLTHVGAGFEWLGMRFEPGGARMARGAWEALRLRVDERAEDPGALMAVIVEWQRWHGRIDPGTAPTLSALAALTLSARHEGDASQLERCAEARLGAFGTAPAGIHRALVEAWSAVDGEVGQRAALLDAAAAVRAGLDPAGVSGLAQALGWNETMVRALRLPLEMAAAALEKEGAQSWAAFARQLGTAPQVVEAPPRPASAPPWLTELLRDAGGLRVEGLARGNRGRCWKEVSVQAQQAVLAEHLGGGARAAIAPVDRSGRARIVVAHFRVQREAVFPHWAPGLEGELQISARQRLAALHAAVHDAAVSWEASARRLGFPAHLEDDGADGRVAWVILDRPVQVRHLWALARRIEEQAGPPRPSVARNLVFPRFDRYRGAGPEVALPLGRHPRTRRFGRWVDARGEPASGPGEDAGLGSADQLLKHVRRGPAAVPAAWTPVEVGGPHASRVLAGCGVLRALAEKADRLGHLSGEERQSVLGALVHLRPVEERDAMLRVILAPTGLSAREIDRRVARVKQSPVSCHRLRVRHEVVAREVGCACRFERLPRWAWPTPVLHAMAPWQVEAMRDRAKKGSKKSASKGGPQPSAPRPEPPTPGASVAPEPSKMREAPPPPVKPPGDSVEDRGAPDPADFAAAVAKIRNIRLQLEAATRGLARAEAQLSALFDRLGREELVLPEGRLVRISRDPPRFRMDL